MLKPCKGCGLDLEPVRFYRTATGLSDRCQSCLRAESVANAGAWAERRRKRAARREVARPATAPESRAVLEDRLWMEEIGRRIEEARRGKTGGRS